MPYPAITRGFSLYELLMTMTLVALVLTLGIPSFGSIVANHRLKVEVNALFHAVHLARKGSIVRRRAITLCRTCPRAPSRRALRFLSGCGTERPDTLIQQRYTRAAAGIAQLVERLIRNEEVLGSNPSTGTNNAKSGHP